MKNLYLAIFCWVFAFSSFAQTTLKHTLNRSANSNWITLEKINENIEDNLVFEFNLQRNFYFHYKNFLPKFWLAFRPEVNFRMQDSFVVLNPAYRFEFSFYYDWSKEKKQRLFILGYDHHSNGKSSSFLDANTGEIDLNNGDFATDFFKIGYLQNNQLLPKEKWSLLQHYQIRWDPGIIRAHGRRFQYERYNQLRINGFWQLLGEVGQTRHRFSIDWRLALLLENWTKGNVKDKLIADLRLNFQPSFLRSPQLWVFAQAYAGEDYYQIYFFRRLAFVRLGVAMRIW